MGKKRHFKGNSSSEDKKRRKEAAEKWKNAPRTDNDQGDWTDISMMTNARFDAFYKAQGFINPGEDWERFHEYLKAPLPACFRLQPDYAFAEELRRELLNYTGKTIQLEDGKEIRAIEPIAWYPGGNAYRLGTDRRSIRKLPILKELHQWMVQRTNCGHITRQEAVSMVPPLALNVESHHRCLDMCASPGSKTSQLLETVTRSFSSHSTIMTQGVVVANDPDTDRAYMLAHQCKRLNSPLLVVTTHYGQSFPTITETVAGGVGGGSSGGSGKTQQSEFFDRVLCDVPCSGDGTLRKNPMIWKKWNTNMGTSLHPLQLSIAKRGIKLLKPGGLLVYSTCSMSPYEDEAVVAELLRSHPDTLELVDARDFLGPNFFARKGLQEWYVLDDYAAVKMKQAQSRKDRQAKKRGEHQQQGASLVTDNNGTTVEGSVNGVNDEDNDDAVKNNHDDENEPAGDDHLQSYAEEQDQDDEGDDNGENVAMIEEEVEGVESKPAEEEILESQKQQHTGDYRNKQIADATDDENVKHCISLDMSYYSRYESVPDHLRFRTKKSLFPPTAEEKEWMQLERCLRCVPQDEDTGGFFVATLRKKLVAVNPSPVTVNEEAVAAPSSLSAEMVVSTQEQTSSITKTKLGAGLVEFHQIDDQTFETIRDFFQFEESGLLQRDHFFIREDNVKPVNKHQNNSKQKKIGKSEQDSKQEDFTAKTIFYFPDSIRDLFYGDEKQQLKIVTAGAKVFEKKHVKSSGGSERKAEYRLLQDSAGWIADHIKARKIEVNIQDICNLLGGGLVSHSTLSKSTLQQLQAINPPGSVICFYNYKREDQLQEVSNSSNDSETRTELVVDSEKNYRFNVVCWKGNGNTLNVMCGRVEIDTLKHQLSSLRLLRPKQISALKLQSVNLNTTQPSKTAGVTATESTVAVIDEGGEEQDGEVEVEKETERE